MVAQTADVWRISKGNNKNWQTSFEAFLKTLNHIFKLNHVHKFQIVFIVYDIIISYSLFDTIISTKMWLKRKYCRRPTVIKKRLVWYKYFFFRLFKGGWYFAWRTMDQRPRGFFFSFLKIMIFGPLIDIVGVFCYIYSVNFKKCL